MFSVCVWYACAYGPRILRTLRTFVLGQELRILGVTFTSSPKVRFKRPLVRNAGRMRIVLDLVFRCPVTRAQIETFALGSLVIGDFVFINEGAIVAAQQSITIGDHVKVGDFVTIHDSNYHETDPAHPARIAPVVIGANVWLARNVTVLPGVTIGANSVVAAGSTIASDVPANVLVGGNPPRVLRQLDVPNEYVRP